MERRGGGEKKKGKGKKKEKKERSELGRRDGRWGWGINEENENDVTKLS